MTSLYIVNLTYIRLKGKTTYGMSFKLGTPEYKRVHRLASIRNLIIFSTLDIIFALNLANSLAKIVRMRTSNAHFLLVFAPIAVFILTIITIIYTRKQYSDFPYK